MHPSIVHNHGIVEHSPPCLRRYTCQIPTCSPSLPPFQVRNREKKKKKQPIRTLQHCIDCKKPGDRLSSSGCYRGRQIPHFLVNRDDGARNEAWFSALTLSHLLTHCRNGRLVSLQVGSANQPPARLQILVTLLFKERELSNLPCIWGAFVLDDLL